MTIRFTHTYNWTTTTPETPFVPLIGLGREDLFLTERPENGTGILGDVLLASVRDGLDTGESGPDS